MKVKNWKKYMLDPLKMQESDIELRIQQIVGILEEKKEYLTLEVFRAMYFVRPERMEFFRQYLRQIPVVEQSLLKSCDPSEESKQKVKSIQDAGNKHDSALNFRYISVFRRMGEEDFFLLDILAHIVSLDDITRKSLICYLIHGGFMDQKFYWLDCTQDSIYENFRKGESGHTKSIFQPFVEKNCRNCRMGIKSEGEGAQWEFIRNMHATCEDDALFDRQQKK